MLYDNVKKEARLLRKWKGYGITKKKSKQTQYLQVQQIILSKLYVSCECSLFK